ncbi:retrovirus-related pol polyprotein from transposon TNT 1-94 [Tanacetum coccineum]
MKEKIEVLTGFDDDEVLGVLSLDTRHESLRIRLLGPRVEWGYCDMKYTGNQNGYNAMQNAGNQVGQNAVQNLGCYNCRGVGHYARNCTEFDLMATAGDCEEIEEVNANCILMANLQKASTSGTHADKAPVYYSDGSTKVCYLQKEREKLKNDFKTHKDELLDKRIQLDKKIKELDNILVKMGQSIQMAHILSPKLDSFYHTEHEMALGYQNPFYLKQAQKNQQSLYNGNVLLDKHDPLAVYDSKETLQLVQESRLKMKQLDKEIKPENYAKINKLLEFFISQKAKSQEEVYFSNTSKTASVSNTVVSPILISDNEYSDDTLSKSVA